MQVHNSKRLRKRKDKNTNIYFFNKANIIILKAYKLIKEIKGVFYKNYQLEVLWYFLYNRNTEYHLHWIATEYDIDI